ncbi:MAG: RraA family protein [Burkholderiales bacterium]|nr:RraA family protein [Burkholderiales bacterium]
MKTTNDHAAKDEADGTLDLLRGLGTADLSDAMYALSIPDSALDPEVRLLAGESLVGRAITIERVPTPHNTSTDEIAPDMKMAIQELIDSARPGSVMVLAAQRIASHANSGGNQALRASKVGMNGWVTDGAIRDLEEMKSYGITIFAKGTSPRAGQHRFTTVKKNEPVVCAGVLINPGDLIVGDSDGVIVIRPRDVKRIVEKAKELKAREEQMQSFIREGGSLKEATAKYKIR